MTASTSPSAPAAASGEMAPSSASAAKASETARAGRGDGSGGGKRYGDAVAYVDGKPKGILRFLEMPPSLIWHPHQLLDGNTVPRYRVAEYVESLGVPLSKVREVHLVGGRGRATVIRRSELEKHRTTLNFSFSRGDSGNPRVHWPPTPIDVNTTIDVIMSIAVYVELEPPRFDPKLRKLVMPDGQIVEGIPYAKPDDAMRGTRVYDDGELAGSIKRKRLPDSVLSPKYDPKKPRFSLEKYLVSVGVDPAKVKLFAIAQRDAIVARMDGARFREVLKDAEFSLGRGSEGKAIVHFLEDGKETAIEATALLAFDAVKASERILNAEIAEPQGGSTSAQDDDSERNE